jgi:adiponectin receptor
MGSPNNPNAPANTSKGNNTLVDRLETKASHSLTVLWNDLPTWLQDNQHIHSGYRPASNSYRKSLASLTHLHNETVNIYTHLIGAVLALLAGVYAYGALRPRYELATQQDVLVFGCFFGGAVGCLGMSAAYHTISNHSEAVARMGNRLDYLGYVGEGCGCLIVKDVFCADM